MKYRALVTAEVIPSMLDALKDNVDFDFDGYYIDHEVMPVDELKSKIKEYDILICEYDTIDKEILDCAEKLKLIICCRGGVKTVIDLEAAKEKGIIICNNGGRNAEAVSDFTLGYILDLTRNISKSNALIQNRVITTDVKSKPDNYKDTVWGLDNNSPFIRFRGKSVNHMTLGLVGCGFAGSLVAKKAKAFDMNIIAYDPFIAPERVPDFVKLVDLKELLANADIVSLHCNVSPETKNMFNKDTFAAMKEGAYFINTARGELVDEDALVEALNSNHLAGAAIDVTVKEPIASDCPLLDAQNLIITPHIAGSSYDVQVCGTRMVAEALEDFIADVKPRNCVVYNK